MCCDDRVETAHTLMTELPAVGPAHRGGFGGSASAWFVSKALSSPSLFGRPMGRGTSSAPALPNLPERVPRAATADPLPLDNEASDDEGEGEEGDGDEQTQQEDDGEADQSHEARVLRNAARKKEEHERKKRRAAAEAEKARQWKEDLAKLPRYDRTRRRKAVDYGHITGPLLSSEQMIGASAAPTTFVRAILDAVPVRASPDPQAPVQYRVPLRAVMGVCRKEKNALSDVWRARAPHVAERVLSLIHI